jgi:hypothetical protein
MLEWFYSLQIWLGTIGGLFALGLGFARRKPSLISLSVLALVELGLLVQFVISIAICISGDRAKNDTVEFFAYLFVAALIPLAAGFWALVERTRWSTVILGIGALTVMVMLVRMHQIWFGA